MITRQLGKTGLRFPRSGSAAWACPACTARPTARKHRHHPRRAGAGITLLDTGDFYGMGHNEMLIARGAEGP